MSAQVNQSTLLDGKKVSQDLLSRIGQEVQALQNQGAVPPKLVVMLVGDDPASQVYVNKKAKTAQKLGILSEVLRFPADVEEKILRDQILQLNADPSVHAVLIQLPLPKHLPSQELLMLLDPAKDVDGLHPANLGKLMAGQPLAAKPCTPAGIITLLKAYNIPLAGQHAVVVGRSNIVGKPMGMLLLGENATVTYCHSKTRDMEAVTRQADIIIAAVGVPKLVGANHIREGAVVVDVGINRVGEQLVGDVDFEALLPKTSYMTPVPGGVGPMTIATLMENTLALYRQQTGR